MTDLRVMESITNEPGISGGSSFSINKFAKAQRVKEVMTTSDFGFMADLIDRGVMAGYMDQVVPATFTTLGYRRDTKELARAGGKGQGKDYQINAPRLIPPVREKGEYLPIDPDDTYYSFKTYKYGCQWDISWEAWLNDNRDLNLLGDYPQSWGMSAMYTREYLFTQAFAANATFFTDAQGNLNDDAGGALSATSLAAAIVAIRGLADPAGNVGSYAGPLYLVVPPSLEFTARAIVGSPNLITGANGTLSEFNPMYNAVQVVVNHFLPTIDAVQGTIGWYLFCDPRIRPAVRYGFLAGYEEPEIFIKAADAQRLAGGSGDPFDGSFLDDDIAFKLRFTFGANLVDYRGAYWSKGTAP